MGTTVRRFTQVDVFTDERYRGNPVAVVHDADDLDTDEMQRIANWTNLSETTFLLKPADPAADYRVRIFTPSMELPFAGHPTLGSAHAWLEAGGSPAAAHAAVQECGIGLVTVSRGDRLAFSDPPLVRSGRVEPVLADRVKDLLGLEPDHVEAIEWVDNGPPWIAVLVNDVEIVLGLRPQSSELFIGAVARHPPGSPEAIEVRGFFPKDGSTAEDPVTGSLNAGLALWLLDSGRLAAPYVAAQGTVLGRRGRIFVSADHEAVWIGGDTVTCNAGTITV